MECPNYYWPWFSEAEYERRYARIRAAMEEKGLDCLVVYGISRSLNMDPGQQNVVYLTSLASCNQTYVVFPLHEKPTVFVTFVSHVKNAKDMTPIEDVRAGGATGGTLGQIPLRVADRLKELGLEKKRIGIVGDSAWLEIDLPHKAYMTLTGALPDAEFDLVTEWYEALRLVKSEEEIALMRRVTAMTDTAYEVMVRATRAGSRPCDLSNILIRAALDVGGRVGLSHIGRTPMSNPDMAYPHYFPLTVPIQMGDVVLTEIAVGTAGYFGKILGTYFVGDPTPEYEKLFHLATKTSHDLHAAIKPGVKGGDLTGLCLDTIQNAGYISKSSVPGWSNRNSLPDIRSAGDRVTDADFVFEKNHCINVVGRVSNREGTMGLWLGDTCVVNEDGIENLQKYPIREIQENIIK